MPTLNIKAPSWQTATTIYLEVLRNNEWFSDAGRDARKGLYELARYLDVINEESFLTPEDAQYLMDKVREPKEEA